MNTDLENRQEEKEKTMNFCDPNCKHCVENIEEFGNGMGCAWYECRKTGKMIDNMDKCPIAENEESEDNE